MNAVQTDKLKPGQILAEEVRDINGRLLLAGGNKIESNHIRIFKIWGISEVNVAEKARPKNNLDPELDPELIAKAQESMSILCRHVDVEHPAIKELVKLAVEFRCPHGLADAESNLHITEPEMPHETQKNSIIDELKQKKIVLPEIPAIVFELNEAIANPMSSAELIAQVVNKSPSLTALLLKIVNSSFYSFPSKIDKVSHAVTLIGTREITGLALGISILSIFKNLPKDIIDMYSFLKHSLACGIFSRVLAAHLNSSQTEQLFVSGLLHDIGRQLLKEWKLPLMLENCVYYHHNPSESPQMVPAAIVHLADLMVVSLGIGTSGEKFIPPLDTAAWESLEFPVSNFEKVIGQATHQFKALEAILQV